MSFEVRTIPPFDRQVKRLAKKHPSLKQDLARLRDSLLKDPAQGTPLGNGCYKLRLAIMSKGKGRSGGARIITHLVVRSERIYLLSLYDKSEQSTVTDKEILGLIEQIPE